MKFLASHDYNWNKAKKKGLPKRWITFLTTPVVIECLVLCTYLHYNLRKTLNKFHEVFLTEDYKNIVNNLKNKFLTLANNPEAFLKRTVALADHVKGDDIHLIDSRVKNMLTSLSNDGRSLLKTVMLKMIEKVNQYEGMNLQSMRVFTNTRSIERSFGDLQKILDKNKRTRNILLKSIQRIRLYINLSMDTVINEDEYIQLRKLTRKELTHPKHKYRTTIRRMATNKSKFTGRSSSLVSDSGYVKHANKRARDKLDEAEKKRIRKKRKISVVKELITHPGGGTTRFEQQISQISATRTKRVRQTVNYKL